MASQVGVCVVTQTRNDENVGDRVAGRRKKWGHPSESVAFLDDVCRGRVWILGGESGDGPVESPGVLSPRTAKTRGASSGKDVRVGLPRWCTGGCEGLHHRRKLWGDHGGS